MVDKRSHTHFHPDSLTQENNILMASDLKNIIFETMKNNEDLDTYDAFAVTINLVTILTGYVHWMCDELFEDKPNVDKRRISIDSLIRKNAFSVLKDLEDQHDTRKN